MSYMQHRVRQEALKIIPDIVLRVVLHYVTMGAWSVRDIRRGCFSIAIWISGILHRTHRTFCVNVITKALRLKANWSENHQTRTVSLQIPISWIIRST